MSHLIRRLKAEGHPLMKEAADEIERLGEIEELFKTPLGFYHDPMGQKALDDLHDAITAILKGA